MSTIAEIQSAIAQLSEAEQRELARWVGRDACGRVGTPRSKRTSVPDVSTILSPEPKPT
ncbi:MAG TPA: hypothetical protein VES69_11820 [Pyrinomonadaceae bacterium]|nr:hypothetical protein [Pyrinomonadaceae bacterium]